MTLRWIEESAPVRWLEGPGQLGILDATQTAQAKALLASWNATDGNQCISNYGLQPEDVNPITWGNRDGWVLSCFTNWWNINHKAPALPPPGTKDGVGWVDIDQEHLTALQQWGLSKGVINAGQASCAANCQNKYALDPVNLATCLAVCATGAPPPVTPPPVSKSCKPGFYLDPKTNECLPGSGPLPPPPNPITPAASTAGVSSGTGLLVIGAVVLAAVAIFAAVVGGTGGAAAPRANPRRRRRSNPRRRKTPMLVDIQCETASGFREFKRIALGGTNPEQMYGRSTADGWLLPDAPEHMSERFHQLLRATGCHVVTIQANPKPIPEAGYAYFYDGSAWKSASDEMWETEVMSLSEIEDAKYVGTRTIDGTRVHVWQLRHGKPLESGIQDGHHYIAQTAR